MKLVILESPYAAPTPEGIARNVEYARACLRDSLLRGEAPIASHLLYTQPGVLRDEVPSERQQGIDAGLSWRKVAEKSVIYADRGVSKGMEYGIKAAREAGLIIEYRTLGHEHIANPHADVDDVIAHHTKPSGSFKDTIVCSQCNLVITSDQNFEKYYSMEEMTYLHRHLACPEMSKFDTVTESWLNFPVHMIDGKLAYCSECGRFQRETPSGITCSNGHGGADQA